MKVLLIKIPGERIHHFNQAGHELDVVDTDNVRSS